LPLNKAVYFRLLCILGDNLLSWSSKRQQTISRSSAEAEYRGVANVVVETAWLRNLLRELHSSLSAATLVYCDNVSAIYVSTNPFHHQRTKHIEIDIHFVRDLVTAGQVRVLHVPSRYQKCKLCFQFKFLLTQVEIKRTSAIPTTKIVEFRSVSSVMERAPGISQGVYIIQNPLVLLFLEMGCFKATLFGLSGCREDKGNVVILR
nr:ribonuclease H-like domain-containing protein [Tanacetum cinerariifolium]